MKMQPSGLLALRARRKKSRVTTNVRHEADTSRRPVAEVHREVVAETKDLRTPKWLADTK